MKDQIIQFIMTTYQWCCQSEVAQVIFMLWATGLGMVAFWGVIELFFFAIEKMLGKETPPPAIPRTSAPEVKASIKLTVPSKPKKASAKKKSAKKPAKKKSKK